MNNFQKLQNEHFFTMVLKSTKDGGLYCWSDANEVYNVKNKKFEGSKIAIDKIKAITSPSFYSNLVVK